LPAVNIKHTKDNQLEMAAPGFEKEDFEISVDNGLLTVSGGLNSMIV
jgi:HSP20 family protein